MNDQWHIDYHLKQIASYSKMKYGPVPETIGTASGEVQRIRRVRGSILATANALRFVTWWSLSCVLLGIGQGVIGFGLFDTLGPVVALVLGGLAVFTGALIGDLYVRFTLLNRIDAELTVAEAMYEKRLEEFAS